MTKVLMVCLGNICRSPLAEGILKSKVDSSKVFVDSAGTSGYHDGEPPDPRSIAIAKAYGIDIRNQKSRKFQVQDFDRFDFIYVMDKSNYNNIIRQAEAKYQIEKVTLLLEEVKLGISEVPDPYYGGPQGFENVYQMIDVACSTIAEKLT